MLFFACLGGWRRVSCSLLGRESLSYALFDVSVWGYAPLGFSMGLCSFRFFWRVSRGCGGGEV